MLEEPEKDREDLRLALSRLGWLSTYTRQFVAARQLLRSIGYFPRAFFKQEQRVLLQILRAAIFGISGAGSRKAGFFSAPYTPSDHPTTHYLSFYRGQRVFAFGCEPDNAHELLTEFRWGSKSSSKIDGDGQAAQTLVREIEAVRRGVSLDAKAIGDRNCDRQFELPIWLGAATEEEARAVALFERLALENPTTWEFWERWYLGFALGKPLDRELQIRIALIPSEIWQRGPDAVATEIAQIEATWMAEQFPQVETLVKSEATGRYDVTASAVSTEDQLSTIISQTRFALETATRGNSGLNPYCVAHRYVMHACEVCPEDANTVEQHFSLAASALLKGLAKGKYQEDEGIEELADSLQRHALQLRSDHPEVGKAYVTRLAQTFRELSDDAALKMADAAGDYADTTEGRLEQETRLDQETLGSDEPPEVKAEAMKRVVGRASKQSLLESASERVKAVDKSGGVTSMKLGYAGYRIIEVVTKHWPF